MNLQDVVDELAETLGRSVVINDLAYRPVVASAQGDDIDEVRARSLLRRGTPPRERDYLETLRIHQSRRPMTIDLAHLGHLERLAVPIWNGEGPVGILWLITGGLPPLCTDDFRAVDSALELARPLLGDSAGAPLVSARSGVLRSLLAADPLARREALIAATRAHGVERGPGTSVRAVAVGHDSGVVQRAALGRALQSWHGHHLDLLSEEGSVLLFLSPTGDREEADAFIAAEVARAGLVLRAIGSAQMLRTDVDLRAVAERAVAAAGIAEVLPELGRRADAAEVGPWMLIADVIADPSRLQWYSPAAHALLADTDGLRRQTVEAFLDGAGHVREVCEKLHIHRTTLYYRLENMPQVVRDALDSGLQRSILHVALKLAAYWGNSGRG